MHLVMPKPPKVPGWRVARSQSNCSFGGTAWCNQTCLPLSLMASHTKLEGSRNLAKDGLVFSLEHDDRCLVLSRDRKSDGA